MRRIDLDYGRRKPWLGWSLFSAGCVVAGVIAAAYASLSNDARQWQTASDKAIPQPRMTVAPSGSGQRDVTSITQELEQANDVVRKLSLPWHDLFKAMESSAVDTVALLSIQPDPQQRTVSLNGEAQAYADVLTYMIRLDGSGALSKVRLVNHEIKRDDPQHPVAFSVTAQWKITP